MGKYIALINPSKRRGKRRKSLRSRAARAASSVPARRRRRSKFHFRARRRNPSGRIGFGGIMSQLQNAGMGAGGAILNDAIFTYVPLPVMLKSGALSIVTRAVGAIGVGYLASFAAGRNVGARMAEGALTVLAYQFLKPMIAKAVPLAGDDISGLGYYSPGQSFGSEGVAAGEDISPVPQLNAGTPLGGVGEYISEGSFDFVESGVNGYIS